MPSHPTPRALHLPACLQIQEYFGHAVRTYGEDASAGRGTEGRRYFVREYTYADPDDPQGRTFHRIVFSLEGERGRKATVWAEAAPGYAFRYIIAVARDAAGSTRGGRVFVVSRSVGQPARPLLMRSRSMSCLSLSLSLACLLAYCRCTTSGRCR
jgi:hypothetical protein